MKSDSQRCVLQPGKKVLVKLDSGSKYQGWTGTVEDMPAWDEAHVTLDRTGQTKRFGVTELELEVNPG